MSTGESASAPARSVLGLRAGALFLLGLGVVAPHGIAVAQEGPILSDPVEVLDFDAPESWAMKYFSAASTFTALGAIPAREAGQIDLELEGIWVPSLSEDQRRVGFGGFKVEDLNRSELFGRVRAAFGVGAKTSVELGVVPPLEVDGLEARLFALAVERPFHSGQRWTAGWRLFGQSGEAKGDLTCTAEDAASAPGSPGNLFGCLAPSRDEVSLDHLGLELEAGYRVGQRFTVHGGVAVVEHDLEFQVDAFTYDIHDRTLQLTDGTTWTVTLGGVLELGERLALHAEALYTPLDRRRRRDPESPTLEEELLHLRGALRWRVR